MVLIPDPKQAQRIGAHWAYVTSGDMEIMLVPLLAGQAAIRRGKIGSLGYDEEWMFPYAVLALQEWLLWDATETIAPSGWTRYWQRGKIAQYRKLDGTVVNDGEN